MKHMLSRIALLTYAPPRPTSIEGITACWWGHRARVCCDHGEIFHNIEPAEEVVDS